MSTSGYARLWCEPAHGSDGAVSLQHDVQVRYDLPGHELPAARTEIARLLLSSDRIGDLVPPLQHWLAQPLNALLTDPFQHSIDLSQERSQSLRLDFGPRNDVVAGAGGICCLVELRANAFSTSLVLATDPTCLGMLADGLGAALTRSRNGLRTNTSTPAGFMLSNRARCTPIPGSASTQSRLSTSISTPLEAEKPPSQVRLKARAEATSPAPAPNA